MPKHETIRLRSAEILFAKINANDPAQRRAAVDDAWAKAGEYVMPPQVVALLRSGGGATAPKAPERNWDALIEAARRKPRTDEDVLREKFGGGGDKASLTNAPVQTGQMRHAAAPAPSSDLDLYEPVGTMPIVGDRVMKIDRSGNAEPSYWPDNRVTAISGDWVSVGTTSRDGFSIKYYADDGLVRILKRKAQTPQVPQADAPSQPFYYTPNGVVALGGNTARFAEYTLTYYDTNTGGSGNIVLGGGGGGAVS